MKRSNPVVVNVPIGPDQVDTKLETKGQYGVVITIGGKPGGPVMIWILSRKLMLKETFIISLQGEGMHVLFPVSVICPVAKYRGKLSAFAGTAASREKKIAVKVETTNRNMGTPNPEICFGIELFGSGIQRS